MTRHYGLHPTRHYPSYAPKVIWHRVKHRLFGPLVGCSCSGPGVGTGAKPSLLAAPDGSCFHSRWRLDFPARDHYRERRRIADLESRMRALDGKMPRI